MTQFVAQMLIRGLALCMLMANLFVHSECLDLTSINNFIVTGILGSYTIITLGLLLEAGLFQISDLFIERALLVGGIVLNFMVFVLALMEFYQKAFAYRNANMTSGVLGALTIFFYMIDICLQNYQ